MAHLACPCGNSIWNGCDGDEVEYEFISNTALTMHASDKAFFSFEDVPGTGTNMWKCDVCDRMMVFDGCSDSVTRYMRRIATDDLPEGLATLPHDDGIIYNNLLFNAVDLYFTRAHERGDAPEYAFWDNQVEYEGWPPLTFEIMQREIFSHKNGRFSDWWYASLYDDYLVFYSPYDPLHEKPPVKAWKRYEQIWPEYEEPEDEILEEADDAEESKQ